MSAANTKTVEEGQIRAVIQEWAHALRAKDADRVVSQYTTECVKFILAPPLQYTPDNPFDKKSLEDWFSSFLGPIQYETRDLNITAGEQVGFCHSLGRMTATTTNGPKKLISGFGTPSAFVRSMAGGRSRMSIARRPSTWTVATKRRSI